MASKRHPSKKQVAYALAFAAEWGASFAVAKRLANAVADADADAFNNILELRGRVERMEREHGVEWSSVDEDYRPCPTSHYHGQHDSTTDMHGLLAPSIVD